MRIISIPDPEKRTPRAPWGLRAWLLPEGTLVENDGVRWKKVRTYDFWETQLVWKRVDDVGLTD